MNRQLTLKAWSSKKEPPASSGGLLNPLWSLFSAVLSFDSLEQDLPSGTGSFDHSTKANQLGPELVTFYLLLDNYV